MPTGKKGAFDLSLSFIIIVVFAAILLTLGVTWLRGVITSIGGLTDDLTQQASTKLQETFQQSTQNFAIWPPAWTIERGKGIKMSAAIKNNAQDSKNHNFLINVIPLEASNNVKGTCTGSISSCSISVGDSSKSLYDFMLSWVTWGWKTPTLVERTQIGPSYIDISVPSEAPAGIYQFGVIACKTDGTAISTSSQCTPTTLNWGGSMQPLEITVK